MALNATIYTFEINLSDLDRKVYQALAFRAAKHPSEADSYPHDAGAGLLPWNIAKASPSPRVGCPILTPPHLPFTT